MDLPALLAAPTARGGQHGGGAPGRPRRGPGPPVSAGPGRRRLLLLRGPEDGGPEPRRDEAPGPSPPSPEDGGDSFVVLLEVARGAAAEAPGRREAEPGPGASPAGRPNQGPSGPATAPGAALAGTVTIDNRDLLVRFDRGVFTLAAAPPPAPGPPSHLPPGRPGAEAPSLGGVRRAAPGAGAGAPGYRCPEPQCALAFAKKHQLKVHLLTHGGLQGRRPFKCPLDGCGWAFTTSYKLKRHLQSHDKLRPFGCPVGGCGKKFTTVYNLKAHMKGHEQESLFKCEVCAERFPTHAKLSSHQRSHFEPERPYKCDFPGCEKTFITVSALFSHNRAHFREQELFSCSFPGCSKQYDKACRLKIHLRSHTGERPFICDSDSCGWTFTSMSKLLRHKRKHDDDRRFTCPVEGCGKSFTRAEHLKGHSITHLGTKPFECPVEGCCARFSARSSLYIHSKKHLQDVGAPKSRCPVSSCNKLFTSKHSMNAHVLRQHSRRQDLVPQLETPSSLTPSSELSSPGQSELTNIDLAALFSDAPATGSGSAGGSDEALNSGILTIDVTSVSSSLGGTVPANNSSLGPMDPLVLVAHSDIAPSLESPLLLGTAATVLQPGSFSVDDVHAVGAGPVGCLVALPVGQDPAALTSGGNLATHITTPTSASASPETVSVPELLAPVKVERDSPPVPDVAKQQQGSQMPPQSVFSSPAEHSAQKGTELSAGTGNLYLESGGSARTDYRAIQLAKKKKQEGTGSEAASADPPAARKHMKPLSNIKASLPKKSGQKERTWALTSDLDFDTDSEKEEEILSGTKSRGPRMGMSCVRADSREGAKKTVHERVRASADPPAAVRKHMKPLSNIKASLSKKSGQKEGAWALTLELDFDTTSEEKEESLSGTKSRGPRNFRVRHPEMGVSYSAADSPEGAKKTVNGRVKSSADPPAAVRKHMKLHSNIKAPLPKKAGQKERAWELTSDLDFDTTSEEEEETPSDTKSRGPRMGVSCVHADSREGAKKTVRGRVRDIVSVRWSDIKNSVRSFQRGVELTKCSCSECPLHVKKFEKLQNEKCALKKELSQLLITLSECEREEVEWKQKLHNLRCMLQEEKEKNRKAGLAYERSEGSSNKKEKECKEIKMKTQLENGAGTLGTESRTRRNQLNQVSTRDKRENKPLDKFDSMLVERSMLKLEIDEIDCQNEEEVKKYLEYSAVLRQMNDEFPKANEGNVDTLTKTTLWDNEQFGSVKAEYMAQIFTQESDKQSTRKLEGKLESCSTRLAAAPHHHDETLAWRRDLALVSQRAGEECFTSQEEKNLDVSQPNICTTIPSQQFPKSLIRTVCLENEFAHSRDAHTETSLLLKQKQNHHKQTEWHVKETEDRNDYECRKVSDYDQRTLRSIEKRSSQVESEDALLQQQWHDLHDEVENKRDTITNIQDLFCEIIRKMKARKEENNLILETISRELIAENNQLKQRLYVYENEKSKELKQKMGKSLREDSKEDNLNQHTGASA